MYWGEDQRWEKLAAVAIGFINSGSGRRCLTVDGSSGGGDS